MVESHGLESEIFKPILRHHHILLSNVINERQSSNQPSDTFRRPRLRIWNSSRLTLSGSTSSIVAKDNFKMKLISRGHVLLVECKGYESEIFLPHICSRCLVMKSVSPNGMTTSDESNPRKKLKHSKRSRTASLLAASVHAQANCLSKLLVDPFDSLEENQPSEKPKKNTSKDKHKYYHRDKYRDKFKSSTSKAKKKFPKSHCKAAGDS